MKGQGPNTSGKCWTCHQPLSAERRKAQRRFCNKTCLLSFPKDSSLKPSPLPHCVHCQRPHSTQSRFCSLKCKKVYSTQIFPSKQCRYCSKALSRTKRLYCSSSCQRDYYSQQYRILNPSKPASAASIGTSAELIVSATLLRLGYPVYRSLSPNAPCDLIMYISPTKKPLRIEVTTGHQQSPTGKIMHGKMGTKEKQKRDQYDILAIVLDQQKVIFRPDILAPFSEDKPPQV